MQKFRSTPDRDSRYMGLAWGIASCSKDPNTQVGAYIVSDDNYVLGEGYNGPPRNIKDLDVVWDREPNEKNNLCKYDLIVHAEINAMNNIYLQNINLIDSTLYVTALPCPACMLQIVSKSIGRVVYFDFQSGSNSSLQNADWRQKTFEIAKLGGTKIEKFNGSIDWLSDWVINLQKIKILSGR
jgi:dCMP deaminase